MKILFLALFMLEHFSACAASKLQNLPNDFSIERFDAMDSQAQADFINGLNIKSKMKFMSLFLQDRAFDLPPVAYVIFLKDGEFIYNAEAEDGGSISQKYGRVFTGRWKYESDLIIIEASDPLINYGRREVWDNIWVDKNDVGKNSAILTVHVREKEERDGTKRLNYEDSLHDWLKRGEFGDVDEKVQTFLKARTQNKK